MGALPSFYLEQSKQEQENYHQYLRLIGSLSRLFSDSPVPYLAPKVMENIFCKAFNAEHLALSNISYDALKDGLGIGLKTFLHQKGNTEQKVAEFNKLAPEWRNNIDPKENPRAFVEKIAEARNRRIDSTQALKKASNHLYHCITRTPDKIHLFETHMAKIDMDAVKTIRYTASSLLFSDDLFSYNFNFSKSVLLKRFMFEEQKALISIPIQIIEDPLDYLLLQMRDSSLGEKQVQSCKLAGLDYVYLPLYSEKEGKVPLKSGLNQWNASGRARHEDELYIHIPKKIHNRFPSFFPPRDCTFTLRALALKQVFSAKVCQDNGKALMTNPNRELGKWLLRDILKIPVGQLATQEDLDLAGIDSIYIEKIDQDNYIIDFAATGKYEQFKEDYLTPAS